MSPWPARRGPIVINGLRTLDAPVLLVEVISPTRPRTIAARSSSRYQIIQTLRDYFLIDATEVAVLHYRRRRGCWGPQLIDRVDAALTLDESSVTVSLAEICVDTGL